MMPTNLKAVFEINLVWFFHECYIFLKKQVSLLKEYISMINTGLNLLRGFGEMLPRENFDYLEPQESLAFQFPRLPINALIIDLKISLNHLELPVIYLKLLMHKSWEGCYTPAHPLSLRPWLE
jgi:hypothetical protein